MVKYTPLVTAIYSNTALNYVRSKRETQPLEEADADDIVYQFVEAQMTVEQSLDNTQKSLIVANLIEQLPVDAREIVLLYYQEQRSSSQVARLLGRSLLKQSEKPYRVLVRRLSRKCLTNMVKCFFQQRRLLAFTFSSRWKFVFQHTGSGDGSCWWHCPVTKKSCHYGC